MRVISNIHSVDYKPITPADADPSSELRGTWSVGAPHVVETRRYRPVSASGKPSAGDVLVAKGKRVREYAPGEFAAELLSGLLELGQGRIAPTAFADRFGLMGYNKLVPNENCCDGEPLSWLSAHAHTLLVASKIINLVDRARRSDAGRIKLANYLREELPSGPYAYEGHVHALAGIRGFPGSPVMAANGVLRYLLNPNIEHVGRQLIPVKAELRSIFVFRAPIEVAYWYLAQLYGKETLRRCRECGRVFMHEHPVKYCLPVPPKTISPCKSRFNVHNFRRKSKRVSRRRKK